MTDLIILISIDFLSGFQLVNRTTAQSSNSSMGSSNLSSSTQFSPDTQECIKCASNQYIIYPNVDMCLPCPKGNAVSILITIRDAIVFLIFVWGTGATCIDGRTFLPTDPNLPGNINSTWDIEETDGLHRWRIIACPAGYIPYRDDTYPDQDHCSPCPENTYLLQPASIKSNLSCFLCPVGGICEGTNIVRAQYDYWRKDTDGGRRRVISSQNAFQPNEIIQAEIFRCPPGACLGNNICSNNATGPVCGICLPGWAFTSRGCFECPSEDYIAPIRNIAIAILCFLFCIVWYHMSWRALYPKLFTLSWIYNTSGRVLVLCFGNFVHLENATSTAAEIAAKIRSLASLMSGLKITQHIKILISYFQVAGSFISFHVQWPQLFVNMMVWFKGTFNFAILELPGVSCLWAGISFKAKLLFYTIFPIGIAVLLYLPVVVEHCLAFAGVMTKSRNQTYDLFWNNILFLACLVYPITSLITLQSFDCEPLGLGLLSADYREKCPDSNSFFRLYSIPFIVVYPIGVPVMMFVVIRSMKVPQLANQKINCGLLTSMIASFVKQTSSVESQRLAQMIGQTSDKVEFKRRCIDLHRTLFSYHDSNVATQEAGMVRGKVVEGSIISDEVLSVCQYSLGRDCRKNASRSPSTSSGWKGTFLMKLSEVQENYPRNLNIYIKSQRGEQGCEFHFSSEEVGDMIAGRTALLKRTSSDIVNQSQILNDLAIYPQVTIQIRLLDPEEAQPSTAGMELSEISSSHIKNFHGNGIEGTDLDLLMALFKKYDEDGNGYLDENEFLKMCTTICEKSWLFTGAENGQRLSSKQLLVLLRHKWPTKMAMLDNRDMSALFDSINTVQKINSNENLSDTKDEDEDKQAIQSEESYQENLSHEELLARVIKIGQRLRKDGIIALPIITWDVGVVNGGGENEESEESNAIRKAGFLFLAYKVEYWYWETVEMFRRYYFLTFFC